MRCVEKAADFLLFSLFSVFLLVAKVDTGSDDCNPRLIHSCFVTYTKILRVSSPCYVRDYIKTRDITPGTHLQNIGPVSTLCY